MSTLRPFRATDILRFNAINLDEFTETFGASYYGNYLAQWPDLFFLTQAPSGTISSYMMGKCEGEGLDWKGHVSAVTVAPTYRRLGLASILMDKLEIVSDQIYKGNFVDLYVRPANWLALQLYKRLGYVVYRRVLGYYHNEDAYDMRKSLTLDLPACKSMIPLKTATQPGKQDRS